jgi:hypothetical protein
MYSGLFRLLKKIIVIPFFFQAILQVDKNARKKNAPEVLEEQEFFGEVMYYFAHEYIKDKDEWQLLALVKWVTNPIASGYGPLIFRNLGQMEIINIDAIKRPVGFFVIPNNQKYILDRKDHV